MSDFTKPPMRNVIADPNAKMKSLVGSIAAIGVPMATFLAAAKYPEMPWWAPVAASCVALGLKGWQSWTDGDKAQG